jgi:hypothetical protein
MTPALSPEKTLRQLFLTLFLRGHSARGMQRGGAPKSVASKLALTLLIYGLMGCVAFVFMRQSVFGLSLYLHGMTFMFLGMFVAASAGEVLFNQQEGDILLHRPIAPRTLLWAKIAMLVQVSLWLAGAFNLIGLFAGMFAPDGGWRYPLVHAFSTALEALFCTGTVVLVYQLCLRWFGRERLNNLMTTAQVVLGVSAVAAGQIVPRLMGRVGALKTVRSDDWWMGLLPPAWFAGLDEALAGSSHLSSWLLGALALAVTTLVLWLAFGKLADDYVLGLQSLGETATRAPKKHTRRRWLDRMVEVPPLSWWLRDSVSRAGFLLTLAYLVRDRDVKLRLYPSLASLLVMPFVMLLQTHRQHGADGFSLYGISFAGAFLGLVPVTALGLLQYSQNWQAADIFRAAPLVGPTRLYHGARQAVLLFLAFPLAICCCVIFWLLGTRIPDLALMLPGLITLPVFALIPGLGGRMTPLSQPIESAKSAGRGWRMIAVMLLSMALGGMAAFAWTENWFGWFVLAEAMVAGAFYSVFNMLLKSARWPSME